jgi:hypothetical protein
LAFGGDSAITVMVVTLPLVSTVASIDRGVGGIETSG